MTRAIRSNWFLLALAGVFLLGHFAADPLAPLARQSWLRSLIVMGVMWSMGVTLKSEAIRRSVRHPTASLLAIGSNLVLVPLLCLPAVFWFSPALGGGLFVAGLVPCTLASASVWTRKAGGDDSIAMVTTVVTNLACVAVVPLGIQLVLALQTRVPPLAQMEKLAWFVVLPLVVAQAMRRWGWAGWADRNKPRLSLASQLGILTMVLFGAIAGSSFAEGAASPGWGMLAVVALAAGAVHLLAMGAAMLAARQLGLDRGEQIAVGIAGSQKTLMIGLQIAIDCGVSVAPMLIYHAGQLLTDTLIAGWWKRASDRQGRQAGESPKRCQVP
jgi:sodium/bile acid cotransporter 7